jgi:hypothetical protein
MSFLAGTSPMFGSMCMTAFSMLMMNLGSRFLFLDIGKGAEAILKHPIVRKLTLFCIFFMGTRSFIMSLIFVWLFTLFNAVLLNESSEFCVLPSSFVLETKRVVSHEEYVKAQETIKHYEAQKGANMKEWIGWLPNIWMPSWTKNVK